MERRRVDHLAGGELDVRADASGPLDLDPQAFVHRNPLILLAVFLFLLGMQAIMLGLLAEIGMRTLREMRGGRAHVVARVLGRDS